MFTKTPVPLKKKNVYWRFNLEAVIRSTGDTMDKRERPIGKL